MKFAHNCYIQTVALMGLRMNGIDTNIINAFIKWRGRNTPGYKHMQLILTYVG